MNVSLISAPTVTEYKTADEWSSTDVQSSASRPQLGLLSLAAVLEETGHHPGIVDVNAEYLRFAAMPGSSLDNCANFLASQIVRSEAELYGFGSICSTYPLTVRIAESVKRLRPDATILFGGPQASVVDVATLEAFPFVDLVLRGESEVSLPLLISELTTQRWLDRVDGLTYRDGVGIRRNQNAPVILDLNSLPFPAYHLSDCLNGAEFAALEMGRGCPFSCTFCSTNDFFRRNFRLRSPQRILDDMRKIAEKYSITTFSLVHDMFTVDKRRVAEFCNTMIASGEGFKWSCSARTDCVDEGLLDLMARGGCVSIFYGVEAGSRRMQKIIDKHLDPQRAEEIIDITEKLGINSIVSLITGFPEETWNDVRETLRIFMHSARCPKSGPQLNILAPLAATPIYSAHKEQMVLEELCSDMSHQGLTQNEADLELIRNHQEIFPNFYLLPMPNLERDALMELREFLTMATECFRWLFSAIDQSAADILNFYFEWRARRLLLHPHLVGTSLRRYYVSKYFRSDFLAFVQRHPVAKEPMTATLLAAEGALARDTHTMRKPGQQLPPEEPLWWTDVPSNTKYADVIELQSNLQRVIKALKSRSNLPPQPKGSFYAIRESSDGNRSLIEVSGWLAALIRACDGTRTIKQVVSQLSSDIPQVEEKDSSYVFVNLLQEARNQGVVAVYRD
jgi:radical SAM superfamily enzyme YgiQ (UPF0313 family)